VAQALEAQGVHGVHGAVDAPHCEACAARAAEAANLGLLGRSRAAFGRWLNALNGTPVLDISRGDLGSIRRLAEA
jgi:hypothetical protein